MIGRPARVNLSISSERGRFPLFVLYSTKGGTKAALEDYLTSPLRVLLRIGLHTHFKSLKSVWSDWWRIFPGKGLTPSPNPQSGGPGIEWSVWLFSQNLPSMVESTKDIGPTWYSFQDHQGTQPCPTMLRSNAWGGSKTTNVVVAEKGESSTGPECQRSSPLPSVRPQREKTLWHPL